MKRNKVVILTLTDDIYCIGPRRISSQLKRAGFEVNLVFLTAESFSGQIRQRFSSHFDNGDLQESVYRQLLDLCRGAAIVGFSVWTHQAEQVERITQRLQRELDALIVWGGIHPTSFPDQCLETVDGICLGEGDISFLRLAEAVRDGAEFRRTRGFWFRDGSRVIKNPEEPLVMDLDELPFLDFEFDDHFVNDGGALRRMNMPLMKKYYGGKMWTMFSQGCPYRCTFCSNDLLIELDDDYRKFRRHSADFFMAEVRYVLSRYPHIYNIVIDDDAYMFLPFDVIREFAGKYRASFDIPFFVSGIIPASVDEDKFQVLMDAGMIKARVGIQSGNPRIMKEIFVRPLHDHKMVAGSKIAYRNRKKLAPVQYDLIVDNPLEHPEELKDTLRLIHTLKPPYTFAINALTLLPGTTIYQMGERDGMVDRQKKITLASYVHFMPTMLNLTLAFYNICRVPGFWLDYVLAKDFGSRTVTMKQYPAIGAIINVAGVVKKVVHGLLRRDISAMPRPLDRWLGSVVVRRRFSTEPNPQFVRAFPAKNSDTPSPRERAPEGRVRETENTPVAAE